VGGRPRKLFYAVHGERDGGGTKAVSTQGPRGKQRESVLRVVEEWFSGLSPIEQFCWAFDILPSEATSLMWTTIWYDVNYKIKIRLDVVSRDHLQIFNTLAEILSSALGGKKNKGEPTVINDLPPEVAVAKMNEVFQMAGAA